MNQNHPRPGAYCASLHTLIEVYADNDDGHPVYEELPARKVDTYIYELLSSPGLALNLARGDIVSIKNPLTHAVVLQRGGHFCVQVYADTFADETLVRLELEVAQSLDGTLDGVAEGNLALSIPATQGLERTSRFFDQFFADTDAQWFYGNIYQNLDDDEDETLLDWWLTE
ncbi:DUF4265 domain-containing protein [Pseudomonas sp. MAFF 302046]|uniref:DUF4265 domain-containing protein n=1 Tax=Pseudomonas morbosilactucae TaxID=2938197 RepID=A0ABT0JHE5_9PSED|nr:DUF4265 domain-containing protein [Pseudomonas morbosilactucae]MCK9815256.1 DUF4265 domain-containing protein [Pseudomonas morbosilactucae]